MQAPAPLPNNIVLIGFMGCGKSTISRELRRLLGYPLVDMDAIIEQRAGKPISRIFEEDGEGVFRDMESGLLGELAGEQQPAQIIATGGGVVIRPENRAALPHLGYVVWLCAPPEVIVNRTRNSHERPLLHAEDPLTRISDLLSQREPWYRQCAHLSVDTAGLSSREIATGILESARYFFTGHRHPLCQNP
ncbi:MAG: shikimate kinase [Verrucomicrobia bacterium]|nr:MAG: shikimate kinase [Verrucomicrobiota bacterium]